MIGIAKGMPNKRQSIQMMPLQAPQSQPIQPQRSTMGVLTDMAKSKAMDVASEKVAEPMMTAAFDKGKEMALSKAAKMGLTGAGTSGAMAGLGAAVPYIGAGLLAGKALGFFNKGGPVYAENGQFVGPLAIRKIRYKQDGGKIEVEATMGE